MRCDDLSKCEIRLALRHPSQSGHIDSRVRLAVPAHAYTHGMMEARRQNQKRALAPAQTLEDLPHGLFTSPHETCAWLLHWHRVLLSTFLDIPMMPAKSGADKRSLG